MNIVPRQYQINAVNCAVTALQATRKALVVIATGLGKTITSALIAKKLKAHRVLFLVHNNFILEKSVKEYRKVFGESMNSAIYNGFSKSGAKEANFVFASFQTMARNLGGWLPGHFDLMVVDESHHSHAKTYKPVIEYFNAPRLGITATPNRSDLQDIRKFFGQEVINISLEEAIANGWLPRIEYHVVTDDGFNEEVLQQISKEVLQENRRISLDELNRRVFVKARDKKIADIIHGYNEKTLVFCRNIPHANHFCTFLKLAAIFHSSAGTSQKHTWNKNQDVLEQLQNGLLLRVLAVNAFNEGVDVPTIGLVVFLRVTDSETVFLQQLGRGMRPGKDKLVILDFVGNVERIMMLRQMTGRIAAIHKKIVGVEAGVEEFDRLHLSGKGFEFTFSNQIIDLMRVIDRTQVDLYPTWQEASEAAIKLGIKTNPEYLLRYKEDPRLPGNLRRKYGNKFPGFGVFLKRRYLRWQEASRVVRNKKLTSRTYKLTCKQIDRLLPRHPESYYPDFPDWDIFLGNKKAYNTCEEAMRALKRFNFRNRKDYESRCKSRDAGLPTRPQDKYSDFPGWDVFLGRKPLR